MRLVQLWFYLILGTTVCSQVTIQGTITDASNAPISGAIVAVHDTVAYTILGYSISDTNGKYQIDLKAPTGEVEMRIRKLNFKTTRLRIQGASQVKNVTLQKAITELKPVHVKPKPIRQKGDTINYSVDAFSKKEDRSIGDVIKNMPGIEVLADGKILYQGTPINKYYRRWLGFARR